MEVVVYILGGLLIGFIVYHQIQLIYNRYIRSYKFEIEAFLYDKKYQRSFTPNKKDWLQSPFVKPVDFKIQFVLIKLNGLFITWSKKDYLVVEAQRGREIQEYWLEITTIYFQQPKLSFKPSKKRRKLNAVEQNRP